LGESGLIIAEFIGNLTGAWRLHGNNQILFPCKRRDPVRPRAIPAGNRRLRAGKPRLLTRSCENPASIRRLPARRRGNPAGTWSLRISERRLHGNKFRLLP
jgi:hypothetical protein